MNILLLPPPPPLVKPQDAFIQPVLYYSNKEKKYSKYIQFHTVLESALMSPLKQYCDNYIVGFCFVFFNTILQFLAPWVAR